MTDGPTCIVDSNLSRAWAKAFLQTMEPGQKEIAPLVVTITGFSNGAPEEDPAVRELLDRTLAARSAQLTNATANTIFPRSLWNPAVSRHQLYERHRRIMPRLKRVPQNQYGRYFDRLIAFSGDNGETTNQLEHIIATFERGNHRRSALQAAIFDPRKDHTHQRRRGFPCMQQLSFAPYDNSLLAVNAFYATQSLFERAYGNYLGLQHLGQFMAHELGFQLGKVTCMTGIALRSSAGVAKKELQDLASEIRCMLAATGDDL